MENILKLIRDEVIGQQAYPIEGIECPVKLDANENPLPMPDALRRELQDAMARVDLNRYPEAGSIALRNRFARHFGVDGDMVLVGNGSDELIQVLCTATARPGASVLIPTPTFAMYRIAALNCGQQVREVPLTEAFDLDLGAIEEEIRKTTPSLVFLAYPNNPTGNCFSRLKVEAIIEASPGIVVVDEAYADFSGRTVLPLINRYRNLVILKTLSKVGLAAMRIGFLIGPKALLAELNKVRLPYNLNSLSQVAGHFYLDHEADFLSQVDTITAEREKLLAELQAIEGIHPYPTDANFIFFSCNLDANRLYTKLIQKGVLLKSFGNKGSLKGAMRVTVGTSKENKEFIEILRGAIAE